MQPAFAVLILCLSLLSTSNALSTSDEETPELQAAREFREFFVSINNRLVERSYVVEVAKAALLAKEHVLMMGPPGNAKSLFADSVLRTLVDEQGQSSYFKLQMTPETTLSETHGPLDFLKLTQENTYERKVDQGMLWFRNVFIDEIFDGRANTQRNILMLLNERVHAQGSHITPGKLETAFAATNRYISEVYERAGDDGPKALLDRFAFSVFVPGSLESVTSCLRMMSFEECEEKKLSFESLDTLRSLMKKIEVPDYIQKTLALLTNKIKIETEAIENRSLADYDQSLRNGEKPKPPYRATKYMSPRTMVKAHKILKALVLVDWIAKNGQRNLRADMGDLGKLEQFFTLNGPSDDFVRALSSSSNSDHERAQLMAILQERQIFKTNYEQINGDIQKLIIHHGVDKGEETIWEDLSMRERKALVIRMMENLAALKKENQSCDTLAVLTAKDISAELIKKYYTNFLASVASEIASLMVGTQIDNPTDPSGTTQVRSADEIVKRLSRRGAYTIREIPYINPILAANASTIMLCDRENKIWQIKDDKANFVGQVPFAVEKMFFHESKLIISGEQKEAELDQEGVLSISKEFQKKFSKNQEFKITLPKDIEPKMADKTSFLPFENGHFAFIGTRDQGIILLDLKSSNVIAEHLFCETNKANQFQLFQDGAFGYFDGIRTKIIRLQTAE